MDWWFASKPWTGFASFPPHPSSPFSLLCESSTNTRCPLRYEKGMYPSKRNFWKPGKLDASKQFCSGKWVAAPFFTWESSVKSGNLHTWGNKYEATTAEYAQVESTIRTLWVERQEFSLSSSEVVSLLFIKTKGGFPTVFKKLQGFIFCKKNTLIRKSFSRLMQTRFRYLLIDKASLKSHLEAVGKTHFYYFKTVAFPCQKQTPSSFRFCPYVQHGKSGRPLVISLELQHCSVVSEQSPPSPTMQLLFSWAAAFLWHRKKDYRRCYMRQKALGMRTGILWAPDTLQGKTRTQQEDKQTLQNWDLLNEDAFAILRVLSDLFWLPLSLCGFKPKPIPWTGAVVCRGMGREGGGSRVWGFTASLQIAKI